MDHLEIELDNIRRALEWSISNRRGDKALRLVGALGWFWIVHCHFLEGSQWFKRAFELQEGVTKDILAKAFGQAGSLAWIHQPSSVSRSLLKKSIALLRELDNRKELSNRLLSLGLVELSDGNLKEARSLFEETMLISRGIGHGAATVRALFNLANISSREGDNVTASKNLEESLAISRQLADDHLTSMVLLNTGGFALYQQDYSNAREYYEEALKISLDLKNKRVTALAILGFADILCARSFYSQSAILHGYAISVLKDLGAKIILREMGNYSKTIEVLRENMDEDSYQKDYQIGAALSLEDAIEIALKQLA
jgi:tetratricopeptide (TPR) repeat protein